MSPGLPWVSCIRLWHQAKPRDAFPGSLWLSILVLHLVKTVRWNVYSLWAEADVNLAHKPRTSTRMFVTLCSAAESWELLAPAGLALADLGEQHLSLTWGDECFRAGTSSWEETFVCVPTINFPVHHVRCIVNVVVFLFVTECYINYCITYTADEACVRAWPKHPEVSTVLCFCTLPTQDLNNEKQISHA